MQGTSTATSSRKTFCSVRPGRPTATSCTWSTSGWRRGGETPCAIRTLSTTRGRTSSEVSTGCDGGRSFPAPFVTLPPLSHSSWWSRRGGAIRFSFFPPAAQDARDAALTWLSPSLSLSLARVIMIRSEIDSRSDWPVHPLRDGALRLGSRSPRSELLSPGRPRVSCVHPDVPPQGKAALARVPGGQQGLSRVQEEDGDIR